MDTRIPDEVEMQRVLEVIAFGVPLQPCLGLFTVDCFEDSIGILLLPDVACDQIAGTLRNLKSCLQPHRALR